MRRERHGTDSRATGPGGLITAQVSVSVRHRLPARVSGTFGQFTDSYRAFRHDLRQLLSSIAADRRGLVWLLAIALVGIVVRIWYLDQPMRYDEAWTFLRFVAPGAHRLFDYPAPDNHVLHTLLVYLSTSGLGTAPWAIRLPAFLAGVLLVPASYVCARTVFPPSSGLIAAGLAAASPYLVLYSTNARGYTIIALLTLALVPLCLYVVRTESPFAGCLVALLSALGLYAIPTMLFPLAMLALWSLFLAYQAGGRAKVLRLSRMGVWILLLCAAITLVLYTPVFRSSGVRRVLDNQYVRAGELGVAVGGWPKLAWETWTLYLADMPGWVHPLLGVCLLSGAFTLWKTDRGALLLIPAAVVGPVLTLLATRTIPYSRSWIYLLPLSFCLVDVGVTRIASFASFASIIPQRPRAHVAGALGLLTAAALGFWLVNSTAIPYSGIDEIPDAEALVRYLQPRLEEGDWVQARKFWPLRYYAYRLGMPQTAFGKGGRQSDGDTYVVVSLPNGTFEKATKPYGAPLDQADFDIETFPSSLLYVPKEPDGH